MGVYPRDSPLHKGDHIGGEEGFVVEDFVGGGGFAYIYKVYDLNRRCTAAMKVLRPSSDSSESRERFEREILVLGHLSSNPHTPNLIRRGSTRGESGQHVLDWFVMDYVEGLTLKEALEQARQGARLVQGYHFEDGRMHPLDVLNFLRMVVRCLEQLHTLEEARMGEDAEFTGYVHRDLKSVNIMLPTVPMGYPAQVMVLDFGIAGAYQKETGEVPVDHQLTTTGSGTYTPKYAAPEQIFGRSSSYGPFTDFYTLGVIAYECLTGGHPYDDLDLSKSSSCDEILLRTIMPSYIIELPDDPRYAGVAPIVNKMLRHHVTERPSTAHELYMMLAQVQENPVVSSYGPTHSPTTQEFDHLNRSTQDWSAEAARLASQEFDETQAPREAFFKLEDDRKTKGWRAVTAPQEDAVGKAHVEEKTERLFPSIYPGEEAHVPEVMKEALNKPLMCSPEPEYEEEYKGFVEEEERDELPRKKDSKLPLLIVGMLVLAILGGGIVIMQENPQKDVPEPSVIKAYAASKPLHEDLEPEGKKLMPIAPALLASQAILGTSVAVASSAATDEALRQKKAAQAKRAVKVDRKKKKASSPQEPASTPPQKAPEKAATPPAEEPVVKKKREINWSNWKVK
ncbi:MAG: hypothetical protein CMP06_04275 [Xanthomonadales bacterium]|nr:hypothetical protein [Xanthomonadales bacterium]